MNPPDSPASPQQSAAVAAAEPALTTPPGDGAAPAPAAPLYLPDGTQLLLTLSAKVWLCALFGDTDADNWPGPRNPREDLTVLFFAANPKTVWLQVARDHETGKPLPLVQRPHDLQLALADFADTRLGAMSLADIADTAVSLWRGEHATQVIPVQKKSLEEFPTLTTSRE